MKKFWNNYFNIESFKRNEQNIIGTLNPIHWDRKGKIRQFSIYSEDEEDIIIEGYQNKSKLKKLLNKRVLATGTVRTDDNGQKFIYLKKIKELTGPTSPAISLVKPPDLGLWNEEYSLSIPKEYALAQYNQFSESYWEAC